MTTAAHARPALPGWFTTDEAPCLLGDRCTACGTYVFPPTARFCPDPRCDGEQFERVPLSRVGTVWSYTDARYQPPPPYVPPAGGHEPFAIAAVELAAERMVVLGQVTGAGVADLRVGQQVELVVEPLLTDDEGTQLVWKWKPVAR